VKNNSFNHSDDTKIQVVTELNHIVSVIATLYIQTLFFGDNIESLCAENML